MFEQLQFTREHKVSTAVSGAMAVLSRLPYSYEVSFSLQGNTRHTRKNFPHFCVVLYTLAIGSAMPAHIRLELQKIFPL